MGMYGVCSASAISNIFELKQACTLEMGLRSPRPIVPFPWLQPRAMSFSSLSIARSHACVFENLMMTP